METDRWRRIQELFAEAIAKTGYERVRFLDEACGGDESLRREVAELLRSDAAADQGFTAPKTGVGTALSGILRGFEAALASSRAAAEPQLPGPVGPYKPIQSLGEGGMGVVYLAEQEEPLRRRVALKLIRGGRATAEVLRRFRGEIETLAQMSHPGIARVYDAGATADGHPYFVMEYVEGGVPITDYSDERRLGIRERLELFLRLCEAVQHAHQKGVIHRDIKPSNILVTEEQGVPLPKVIDFGIARAVGEQNPERTMVTETGQIIGTPGYMSPEQLSGGKVPVDTRTDIYSLGALLYELLTGVMPFEINLAATNLLDALLTIREKDPVTPSQRLTRLGESSAQVNETAERRRTEPALLRRELRGDLDWIALKALEKDPERRYSSVSDLAADIRRHLNDQPVLAGPPDAAYRLGKFVRRHRWQVVTACAAILVLLGAAVASWGFKYREGRAQLTRGNTARVEFEEQRGRADELDRRWKEKKAANRPFQPPWEREEELTAWSELGEHRKRVEGRFNEAVASFASALEVAPLLSGIDGAARSALRDIYFDRYRESLERGGVVLHPEFFKGMVESLGAGKYRQALAGTERILLESEPGGVDVYCFRFEESDAHLVPIPFHPSKGSVGEPFLRVARTWPGETPFQPGDRLLRLARSGSEQKVRTHAELAHVLSGVGEDEDVDAITLRAGAEVRLRWRPYPKERISGLLRPGRLLDVPAQLRMTFEGYPLDLSSGCRVGRTDAGATLSMELAPGSYLLVLRKDGFVDLKLPVSVPGGGGAHRARLVRPEEIPPGFVLVSGGRFPYGGDSEAYEGLEPGFEDVGDFFIAHDEVTFREYLEFINSPATLNRLAAAKESGHVAPAVDWSEGALQILRPAAEAGSSPSVDLIPRIGRTALLRPRDGAYELADRNSAEWPILGVSLFAGLEYAKWLTEKNGGRWQFRLPTDFEWEKAARGADRRRYVWGDYPIYCFAKSKLGDYPQKRSDESDVSPVGIHPMDESVYGILDLAGSVSEPVITDPRRLPYTFSFATVRGANWDATDARDFHIATRNRVLPQNQVRYVGLRLVASRGEK